MENFLQTLLNGILTSGIYIIVTLGLTLVFGIMRVVNFAHGEFVMLGTYITYWSFSLLGMNPYLTLAVCAVLLFLLGLGMYKSAVERIVDSAPINQVLITFGFSILLQNVALIFWSANSVAINIQTKIVRIGTLQIGRDRLFVFLIGLAFALIMSLLVSRTSLGKTMSAVSQNRRAASLLGINVPAVYLLTFGVSAAIAGISGGLVSIVMYASPYIGSKLGLRAFAILTLAGLGNINTVIWASLILGLSESLISVYVPQGAGWAEGLSFLIILLVLAFKPSGLKGMRAE
jgi:branched-chain amino acid transport system permease protein